MDIVSRLRPHFPAFGDWDYYYYPHYYYTSTPNNCDVDDELHQQDLYGAEPVDLYGGYQDHDEEDLKKSTLVLPTTTTTTTTVIVSPRKIKNGTERHRYERYCEEEEEKQKEQGWVYESPTKYGNPHYQTTHDHYHRAVDEDLYKIPTHQLQSKSKMKIFGFISRCFKPTCVI